MYRINQNVEIPFGSLINLEHLFLNRFLGNFSFMMCEVSGINLLGNSPRFRTDQSLDR